MTIQVGPRAATLIAGAALLALLAGCGGDSGNSNSAGGSSTEASSKAEFVEAANGICEEKGDAIQTEATKLLKKAEASPQVQRQIISQAIVPNLEAEVEEVRSLTPPAGDEAQVERILTSIEDTIDRLDSAKPVDTNSSFEENHPYRPGEQLAAKYGLTACGHP